jgi:HSP20 family protein
MEKDNDPFKRRRQTRDIDDFFRDFWGDQSQGSSDNFFDILQEQMKRMQEYMNAKVNENATNPNPTNDSKGPWIYGWSFSAGTDKEPTFHEFGNIPLESREQPLQITDRPEPFIDIQEEEKEVYVTVEIPGVEKKDIDLTVQNKTLTIDVNHEQRGFHKTIDLPTPVRENKSQASYNNGILHITLQKTKRKNSGNTIPIQ